MRKSLGRRKSWGLTIIGVACLGAMFGCCLLTLRSCGFSIYSPRSLTKIENINIEDRYVRQLEIDFSLSKAISKYDLVIEAIEAYREDFSVYPESLDILIPEYLERKPKIYVRHGKRVVYSPISRYPSSLPFYFAISGNHPGLAFMHGWTLLYCPVEFDCCNTGGDRKMSETRVNDDWIWINSSAL